MAITVTQEHVDNIIERSEITFAHYEPKTLVCMATLPNGFVIVTDASCIDPLNYDEQIGKDICLERLSNRIWELEAYVLSGKN